MAPLHAPIVLHYPSSMLIMFNAIIWLSGAMCLWKGGTEDNDCKRGERKKKTFADASRWRSLQGSNYHKQNSSTCHGRSRWSFSTAALICPHPHVSVYSCFCFKILRFKGGWVTCEDIVSVRTQVWISSNVCTIRLPTSPFRSIIKIINISYLFPRCWRGTMAERLWVACEESGLIFCLR